MSRKAGRLRCPRRHTGPCHVALRTSWRPAFGGWHARHRPWRPGWSPIRRRRHRSLLHHRPRPRLGHGLWRPAPLLDRRQAAACSPACLRPDVPSPALTHAALPAAPSLVSRVSLTPLVLNCLPCQSQRRAGEGHSDLRPVPAPAAGPQCHAGTARPQARPPQPPCCRNLRGPDLRPPPRPGDVLLRFPAHCALCLALLPSRLWRRPGGQARAPAEPSPEWVAVGVVAAGDPAV